MPLHTHFLLGVSPIQVLGLVANAFDDHAVLGVQMVGPDSHDRMQAGRVNYGRES